MAHVVCASLLRSRPQDKNTEDRRTQRAADQKKQREREVKQAEHSKPSRESKVYCELPDVTTVTRPNRLPKELDQQLTRYIS